MHRLLKIFLATGTVTLFCGLPCRADSVAEWISEDTPANRQAIRQWAENYLRMNESAADHHYLNGRFIRVEWDEQQASATDINIARTVYVSDEEPPSILLNVPYWFGIGKEKGEATTDMLRFVLFHERYHTFCHGQDAVYHAVKELRPLMDTISAGIGHGNPLTTDIDKHMFFALAALDELEANVYGQQAFKLHEEREIPKNVYDGVFREYSNEASTDWANAVLNLQPYETTSLVVITKSMGFRWFEEVLKPGKENIIPEPRAVNGFAGCQWLWNIRDHLEVNK